MIDWFDDKTVAVVGNSMSLFNHEYGKEIDSHDLVVRMNKAPMVHTDTRTAHIHGRRTDVWAMWNIDDYTEYMNKVGYKGKRFMVGPVKSRRYEYDADCVLPAKYTKMVKETVDIKTPSTGFFILYFLANDTRVKEVSVFGFDWKETMSWSDKSYRDRHHDFLKERDYCLNVIFKKPNFKHFVMRVDHARIR